MKLIRQLLYGSLLAVLAIVGQHGLAQDFSIVVMPDTQYYTETYAGPEPDGSGKYHLGFGNQPMLNSQIDWIIANKSNPNHLPYVAPISYVAHVGDLVEHGDTYERYSINKTTCTDSSNGGNSAEWDNISAAMYRLEPAGIPYGVAVGNHDQSPLNSGSYDANPNGVPPYPPPTTSCFNQYFGYSHFSPFLYNSTTGTGYYGGVRNATKNNSHFDLIRAGGQDYIIFYLEYDDTAGGIGGGTSQVHPHADTTQAPWVLNTMALYPSRKAIIVTHSLGDTSNRLNFGQGQGQALYDALKGNPNVFLMLGGHIAGGGRRQDVYPSNTTGYSANTITSLVADYQDDIDGNVYEAGDGFFRVYTISNTNNTITATTPTNWTGSYSYATAKQDADNAFQMQLRWASRLDVFYRNKPDNTLGHIHWNSVNWSTPEFLGGNLASDPAVASRGANLLDVFYQGTNGNLKWKSWNGTAWSGETDMGITIYGAPAACARGLYRMDVFYKGADDKLQQVEWNGSVWTQMPAVPVGVTMLSDPSAVSWGPDRMDIAYTTTTGSVGHVGWNGAWTYDDRGGNILGKPGIASRASGELDIFGEGTNFSPYVTTYVSGVSGWTSWSALPGTMGGSPSAAGWGGPGTRVDNVYEGAGANPQLWENYWDASTSTWKTLALGGTPAGAPAVASWSQY